MTMNPISVLGRLLDRSHDLEAEIDRLLGGADYRLFDDSARVVSSAAACQVSMEHGQGLRALVVAGLPTSAVSLMRLQHEALTRSAWLLYAAGDDQIAKLMGPLTKEAEKAANKLPMMKTMLDDLAGKAPAGAIDMLKHFKDVNAPSLHSFVHGGIHALQRGLTGYPVDLLEHVVRSSNGLLTMAGMMLAILSGSEETAKRMSKIQPTFEDCLPALISPGT